MSCVSVALYQELGAMQTMATADGTRKWDMLGIGLSILCGIHCLSVPFLLGALPLLGLGIVANHEFELVMMGIIFVVAAYTYVHGFRAHHRKAIFLFLLAGVAIFAGVRPFLAEELHPVATLAGGLTFIVGHWKNWHWGRVHARTGEQCRCDSAAS